MLKSACAELFVYGYVYDFIVVITLRYSGVECAEKPIWISECLASGSASYQDWKDPVFTRFCPVVKACTFLSCFVSVISLSPAAMPMALDSSNLI
jgi:hypothetical protein